MHQIKEFCTDYETLNPNEYHPTKEKGVIVEIGFGTRAIFCYSWEVIRKIREGALYIGIDQHPFQMCYSSFGDLCMTEFMTGTWVQGRLEEIPLPENTADEIWLENVFGEMNIREVFSFSHMHPGGFTVASAKQYFSELARILKPQGKIFIIEDVNPEWTAYHLHNFNYSSLGLFKEDFSMEFGVEKYWEFVQKYGLTKRINKYNPYLISLTKTQHLPT